MMALRRVKYFDISHNGGITGSIPANFVAEIVPNIRTLYMSNLQLSGAVPSDFTNLGKGRVL